MITHIFKNNIQIAGSHKKIPIICHNRESVREGNAQNANKVIK